MMYTFENFWIPRLGTNQVSAEKWKDGWSTGPQSTGTFVEAPLVLAPKDYPKVEPENARVILVAASGAVGKTTLAREVATRTGAILIDLAKTGTVGENFLLGGLAHAKLTDEFEEGRATILIDGLDEARMRVTTESFEDFIKDVAEISERTNRPVTLFGRTGAVLEAWVHLDDLKITPSVLEIQHHPIDNAKTLAFLVSQELRKKKFRAGDGPDPHTTQAADRTAIDLLVDRLDAQTQAEGKLFVGYAPVLGALARQVVSYNNPSELVARLERDDEPVTLMRIINSILDREQSKLDQIQLSDDSLREKLYDREEQITRLINRLYDEQLPIDLPEMTPEDQQIYSTAMDTWVAEHPFLDGAGQEPSTEVFAGFLSFKALEIAEIAERVRKKIVSRSAKINPFISSFFLPPDWSEQPEEHEMDSGLANVPLVFSSLMALVPQAETVWLSIQSESGINDDGGDDVEVEISRWSPGWKSPKYLRFAFKKNEALQFGASLGNVQVIGDNLDVEIGQGQEAIISAPTTIEVSSIILNADKLTIEPSTARHEDGKVAQDYDQTVTLRCDEFQSEVNTRPTLRTRASLSVFWNGSAVFPWKEFSIKPPAEVGEEVYQAFNRMRKLLLPFKSDRYGELAKYRKFVDHKRRIKGVGKKVRDQLVEEGLIFTRDHLYVLNSEKFQETTDLNYQKMRNFEINDKAIAFLQRALARKD